MGNTCVHCQHTEIQSINIDKPVAEPHKHSSHPRYIVDSNKRVTIQSNIEHHTNTNQCSIDGVHPIYDTHTSKYTDNGSFSTATTTMATSTTNTHTRMPVVSSSDSSVTHLHTEQLIQPTKSTSIPQSSKSNNNGTIVELTHDTQLLRSSPLKHSRTTNELDENNHVRSHSATYENDTFGAIARSTASFETFFTATLQTPATLSHFNSLNHSTSDIVGAVDTRAAYSNLATKCTTPKSTSNTSYLSNGITTQMAGSTVSPTPGGRPAPIPENEEQRLSALRSYDILDSDIHEQAYDDIARLACQICGTPIALVSLVDENRQWFKACIGAELGTQTSRDSAFCAYAILNQDEIFVVNDTLLDDRFADNPLVTGFPYIRFYAGCPLIDMDGLPLGTVCIINTVPQTLTNDQMESLRMLSRQAVAQLTLRRQMRDMKLQYAQLQLTRDELMKSKFEAETAARAKADFLSNMSHEIRTPMNGVLGVTALLSETQLTDEQSDYLHTIQSSGEHLLAILNDILDFSKHESGKLQLETRALDIFETLEQAIELSIKPVKGKYVDVVYQVDERVPRFILSDITRLRQIISNIVSNAYKFTSEGSIIVRVKLLSVSPSNAYTLQFSVTDTGIGMSDEAQRSLFQAFAQANNSTTRQFGGTGLGLAISYKLAQLMNTQSAPEYQQRPMWAVSEVGKGSTFYFTITTYKSETGRANSSPRVQTRRLSRPPSSNQLSSSRSSRHSSEQLLDSPLDGSRTIQQPTTPDKLKDTDTVSLQTGNFSTNETPGTRLRRLNDRTAALRTTQTQPVMVQRALGLKQNSNQNLQHTMNSAANNAVNTSSSHSNVVCGPTSTTTTDISTITTIPGERRMILVMEPSAVIYESISDYLNQRSYKTLYARCHRDALDLIKQCNHDNIRIDCCLITHELPRIDGVQIWQSIQALWSMDSRSSTPGHDSTHRRLHNESPLHKTQQSASRQNSIPIRLGTTSPTPTKANPCSKTDSVDRTLDSISNTRTPKHIHTANTLAQLSLSNVTEMQSPPTPLPFQTQPLQLAASRRSISQPGNRLTQSADNTTTSIQSCVTAFPMPAVVFILPAQANGDITHLPEQYWYSTRKPLKLTKLLPLLKAAIGGKKPSRNPIKQQELLQKSLATHFPVKILLAEDNSVNLKVALKMFGLMGYTIDTAENGQIAVDKVKSGKHYHLIFLDMQMPVMDGVTACSEILTYYRTELPKASAPIVIAMTANVLEQDRLSCFAAGCVDFISKPVQMKVLQDKIKYWGSQSLASQR